MGSEAHWEHTIPHECGTLDIGIILLCISIRQHYNVGGNHVRCCPSRSTFVRSHVSSRSACSPPPAVSWIVARPAVSSGTRVFKVSLWPRIGHRPALAHANGFCICMDFCERTWRLSCFPSEHLCA